MTYVKRAAGRIRKDYKDNALLLHRDEERVIADIDHWMFGRFTNEDAVKLMDEARAYNTEHHGIKYPARPPGNILITPLPEDYELLTEKAAEYLRQYYKDASFSLQDSEERAVHRLEERMGKMTSEKAARLMDDAKAYNTKHYGTKYPARPAEQLEI